MIALRRSPARAARRLLPALVVALTATALPAAAAAAPPDPDPPGIAVTPGTTGLRDGTLLRIAGHGFGPRKAIAIVQCGIRAASDGPDFCNERAVAVAPSDATGAFVAHFRVHPVIETAGGTIDCRRTVCVLGAENLEQRSELAFTVLSFAPGTPARSEPPSRINPLAVSHRGAVAVASPGRAARLRLVAGLAPRLARGRVGRVLTPARRAVPRWPRRGEGLLRLTLSGPRTSWASPRSTAVVVDVRVDRGRRQTMVLFAGSRPFTYEGFTGSLSTGRHVVTVRVRPGLATLGHTAVAVVRRAQLLVVARSNPGYLALAHAPVLYDRRASSHSDTPLIAYAQVSRLPGGAHRIAYTITWSNEDSGTGFIPFLLWGGYGRMTDVETLIDETVDRSGRLRSATYLGCRTCGAGFPENRTALDETHLPFHGRRYGGHPVLRVATGNNDASDRGRTSLRFQQALAAPPRRGDTREGAMDRNPWTYAIMDQEVRRERADRSTSASSTGAGDARQELIVQLDTVGRGVASIGVDLRLRGDSRVYSNDFGTTQPLVTPGLGRTVVKVPLSEVRRGIAALRLRVRPSGAPRPSLRVRRVRVLAFDGRRVQARRAPRPQVLIAPAAAARTTRARVARVPAWERGG